MPARARAVAAASGLTDMQMSFVQHYLICMNVTQSALKAGYSGPSAFTIGSDLLKNKAVRAELLRRTAERDAAFQVTQTRVLQEMAYLAFANIADYYTYDEKGNRHAVDMRTLTREQWAAIEEISVHETTAKNGSVVRKVFIRLSAKRPALETLAKYLGMYEKDNAQRAPRLNVAVVQLEGLDAEERAFLRRMAEKRQAIINSSEDPAMIEDAQMIEEEGDDENDDV